MSETLRLTGENKHIAKPFSEIYFEMDGKSEDISGEEMLEYAIKSAGIEVLD